MRFWPIVLLCVGLSLISLGLPAAESSNLAARQVKPSQADLKALRTILATPEKQIDLAKVKLTIDHMIDPRIDSKATLAQIDTLASRIRVRFPVSASRQTQMEVLVTSLAQSGYWNDYRPFSYDLDDPLGDNIQNKLLSTYLRTRKGNCVSMPILLVILGQKLGLDMRLATAPRHVLAKFRNDQGAWINIEAVSFGTKRNASYQQEMHISPKAMANGIYLRPLNRREAIGVMLETLMEAHRKQGDYRRTIDLADLALQVNPKDTSAMLMKGTSYYRILKKDYIDRYPSRAAIPPGKLGEFENLGKSNILWFQKAETLGWVQPTAEQETAYLKGIQHIKAAQWGERP